MKPAEFLTLLVPTLFVTVFMGWPVGLLMLAVTTHELPFGKASPRDNCRTIVRRALMVLACLIASWGALIIAASPRGAIDCFLIALGLFAISYATDYLFTYFSNTRR